MIRMRKVRGGIRWSKHYSSPRKQLQYFVVTVNLWLIFWPLHRATSHSTWVGVGLGEGFLCTRSFPGVPMRQC